MGLNLPTGIPFVYELDENMKPVVSMKFLRDEETVRKAIESVAAQGKAKKEPAPAAKETPLLASMVAHMVTGAQAKPLCQPAIDSNCLRKMMDQKSAWATNYSKWEADYRVSIILHLESFILLFILTICSGGERQEQRKEDRNQRFWPDWKVGLEGSSGQGSGGGRHQRPLHRPRLHGLHVQA